jgi:hypothetical protein
MQYNWHSDDQRNGRPGKWKHINPISHKRIDEEMLDRGVEVESWKAGRQAIFGNIALHATNLKTRPTSKSLYLIQRYRKVGETL